MSKIKITHNNNERINNTLYEFEGRRTRNTLSAREIAERAALAEQQIAEMGIPKNRRRGVEVVYGGGEGAWANAYKYAIKTTVVRMVRGSSDWFLTEIWCADLYPQAKQPDRIILTAEQDNIAVEHLRKRYAVKTV